ncbi:MFS transporter [Actinophytocola oryzae]|uniref:EmrB/QacA subfamily drug resistance transporter n=1 Tax=Actinophytocola oryzae TaxID=502181 RepID=A0A4R7UWA3_9PSEU|nr:MFS transporter [Actinophytocola oryzae]TDV41063.1 EmrB/QacA subfamily drug resistance transporter [Actinophytocola oryzae]
MNDDGGRANLAAIPGHTRPDPRRWAALVVLCTATFIIILDGSIVFVAVPSMSMDLALTPSAVQWVVSSYLLSFGGLLLLGGRIADLLGRRRMFMLGSGLLAVSALLCGLAWSVEILIAARVLQGFSAAIMTPTALSILVNMFAEGRERNKALGVWSSAGGVGGTVGALLGGPLTSGPGWSWIFYVNIPFAVLMVVLSPLLLKESFDRTRARTFDVAGALTSTAALVLLVFAIVDAPTAGWGSGQTIGLFVAVLVLLVAFVAVERRSASPLLPLHYFRGRGFVGGNLVIVAVGMVVHGGMGFIMTQYAQIYLGYSPVQYGLMFAVMTVLTIVGSALAGGPLVLRFGPRPVAVAGLLLIGASALSLSAISVPGSFVDDMLLGMLLFGPGLGLAFVAGSVAGLAGVPARDSGVASGVNNASFHIGGALGIAIMSTVALTAASGPNPAAATVAGFGVAFVVAIGFAVLGILAALVLLRRPSHTATTTVITPDRGRRAA